MNRSNSYNLSADGSHRGYRSDGSNRGQHRTDRQIEYDHAMEDEYILEVQSLSHPGFPPPLDTNGQPPTELEKEADVVHANIEIEEPKAEFSWKSIGRYLLSIPRKMRGGLDKRLPIPPLLEMIWSWLGAFLGILAVSVLNEWVSPEIDLPLLVGSFGASAVLIFAVVESKLSQPRNFVGGQSISALVGIICRIIIPESALWICGPLGMSLSLLAMQLTSTTHPPGGATALIISSAQTLPRWHGFSYLVTVMWGSVVMLIVALIVNNLSPHRQYPTYWW